MAAIELCLDFVVDAGQLIVNTDVVCERMKALETFTRSCSVCVLFQLERTLETHLVGTGKGSLQTRQSAGANTDIRAARAK